MRDPVERIRGHLRSQKCRAALIPDVASVRWASGFSGSNGLLLVTDSSVTLFTDARYTAQARSECPDYAVEIASAGLFEFAAPWLSADGCVLVDPKKLSAADYESLREAVPSVEFVLSASWLSALRGAKSAEEIDKISAAQAITDRVFGEILDYVRPGVTEQSIAAEIVYRHLKHGASAMSFDPIVASGPNGALPHARPGNRVLEPGDAVVIDMGCFLGGYASDMTRTVVVGNATDEFRNAYGVVHQAKASAIEMARADVPARDVDAAARSVIQQAQLGDYFVHSLGHGVGLEVHEWPRLASNSEDTLCEHAVVTIEPGVYLPGKWGIRIEDIVAITNSGCRNLTATSDDLIELPV